MCVLQGVHVEYMQEYQSKVKAKKSKQCYNPESP